MSKELLKWYDLNKRDLPWRMTKDPYKIWLSEIMLQQTQVATVIDYFNRFIEAFPTVEALALATEEHVFKLWEGLGYYSRAKNLIRCANKVVADYHGKFPENIEDLIKLPGIGPYTAGAIASIAFDKPEPAVDGNVLRVVSRLYCLGEPINESKHQPLYRQKTMALMTERPSDFTQAMMELGAMICTPKSPACSKCPLTEICCGFKSKTQTDYPVKVKKVKQREELIGIAVVVSGQQVLLIKHNNTGLLANLWGFPRVQLDETSLDSYEKQIKNHLELEFDFQPEYNYSIGGKTHVFTHIKWNTILFFFYTDDKISSEMPLLEWVYLKDITLKALPTALKKQLVIIEDEIEKMQMC